jgi:hypothetical protein
MERAELAQATRLAGLAPFDAAKAVDLIMHAGVLEKRPLTFTHPLLRAGIYREISAAKALKRTSGRATGRRRRLIPMRDMHLVSETIGH